MRVRSALGGLLTVAALSVACGGPENAVVDRYFRAASQGDTQTLSSFATVPFTQAAQKWKVTASEPEQKEPARLADLAKKRQDLDQQIADNKKAATAYMMEKPSEVTQVQDILRKGGAVPGKLKAYADKWEEFNQKDRDLKKATGEAQDALDKEKRLVNMSLTTPTDSAEALAGEVLSKKINVDVTVGGETKPYVMTIKRYELADAGGKKLMSRWVVTGLDAK